MDLGRVDQAASNPSRRLSAPQWKLMNANWGGKSLGLSHSNATHLMDSQSGVRFVVFSSDIGEAGLLKHPSSASMYPWSSSHSHRMSHLIFSCAYRNDLEFASNAIVFRLFGNRSSIMWEPTRSKCPYWSGLEVDSSLLNLPQYHCYSEP